MKLPFGYSIVRTASIEGYQSMFKMAHDNYKARREVNPAIRSSLHLELVSHKEMLIPKAKAKKNDKKA